MKGFCVSVLIFMVSLPSGAQGLGTVEAWCEGGPIPLAEGKPWPPPCPERLWLRLEGKSALPGKRQGEVVHLPPWEQCRLQVVDQATGQVLKGGVVRFPGAPTPWQELPWHAPQGQLLLPCWGSLEVEVGAEGYLPSRTLLRSSQLQVVGLRRGQEVEVVVPAGTRGQVCWAPQRALQPAVTFSQAASCAPLAEKGPTVLSGLPGQESVLFLLLPQGKAPLLRGENPVPQKLALLPPAGERLRLQVLSEEKKPLSPAKVVVRGQVAAADNYPYHQEAEADPLGWVTVSGLLPGKVEVTVSAPGKAREVLPVELSPGQGVELPPVTLKPGFALTGQVTSHTHQPLEGATVEVGGEKVLTDHQGRFTLAGLPQGRWRLVAHASRYLAQELEVEVPSPPLSLVLPAAGEIHWPLACGEERLREGWAEYQGQTPEGQLLSGQGNWDGEACEARFFGLAPGSYQLTLRLPGFVPLRTTAVLEEAGRQLRLPPTPLERGLGLTGRVVRRRDGEPVAGALVRAEPGSPEAYRSPRELRHPPQTHTDEEGHFVLWGLASGPHRVVAEAPGLARALAGPFTPETPPAEVGLLPMGEGFTLRGTVRGPQGPAAGVRLELKEPGAYAYEAWDQTVTDPQGRFAFQRVPPGQWVLRVRSGPRPRQLLLEGQEGEQVEVEVHLGGVRVQGQVLQGGRPVQGGNLLWARGPRKPQGVVVLFDRPGGEREIFGVSGESFTCPIAPDGSFLLEGLDSGPWEVRLLREQEGSAPLSVVLPESPEHSLLLSFPAGTVTGQVVDSQGRGVERAWVEAQSPAGVALARVPTDGAGNFLLGGLPGGEVVLRAEKAAFQPSSPLRVQVPPEGRVEGVRLPLGPPLQSNRLQVRLSSSQGLVGGAPVGLCGPQRQLAFTNAQGEALFENLPPGQYQVCVRALGGPAGCSGLVALEEGDWQQLSLTLEGAGFVSLSPEEAAQPLKFFTAEGCEFSTVLLLGNPLRQVGEAWLLGPLVAGRYLLAVGPQPPRWVEPTPATSRPQSLSARGWQRQ